MNQPRFSVLIANYNNGRFLEDCFNSLLSQTYQNFEVVFVDDASRDDSLSVVNQYKKHLNFNVIVNPVNKGQGYSKYVCFNMAKGDIMGLLDPDDALTPDAIETMVEAHEENPEYSIIYSNHSICDKDLNITHPKIEVVGQIPKGESHLTYPHKAISAFATYKKEVYKKTEGLDATLLRAPDQDLYGKLEEVAPVLYIDKSLYLYRWHENGLSTLNENPAKAFYWKMIVLEKAYKRRSKAKSLIVPKIKWRNLKAEWGNYYVISSLNKLKDKNKKAALKYWLYSLPYIPFNMQVLTRMKILIKLFF